MERSSGGGNTRVGMTGGPDAESASGPLRPLINERQGTPSRRDISGAAEVGAGVNEIRPTKGVSASCTASGSVTRRFLVSVGLPPTGGGGTPREPG